MSNDSSMGFQYAGIVAAPVALIVFLFFAALYALLVVFLLGIVVPMVAFPIVGLIHWIGGAGLFEAIPAGLTQGSWAPFKGLGLILLVLGLVAALVRLHFALWNLTAFRLANWAVWMAYLNGFLIWILGGLLGGVDHSRMANLGQRVADLNFDPTPFVRTTLGAAIDGIRVPYLLLSGGLPTITVEKLMAPTLLAGAVVVTLTVFVLWHDIGRVRRRKHREQFAA